MHRLCRSALLLLLLLALQAASLVGAQAVIDPANMGKGEWIYIIGSARTSAGVTTNAQLMTFLKNKGVKWISVKCGDYGTWWTQFDAALISAARAEGIKIFGYQRVGGTNLTAEINVGKQCLALNPDGYIVDAEVEFNGKHTQAVQMMQSLRATYPTRFIAHAPLPIIDYHQTFPYVEFGTYTDAVMPQCYWFDIGYSPTVMVTELNTQWSKWHATWAAQGNGAAIKPLVPIGQAYNNVPASEITTFVNTLKSTTSSATDGGYRGVSFWSAQHHNASQWTAIGSATIGGAAPAPGANDRFVDNNVAGYSESGTWSSSTGAGFYGTNSRWAATGGAHVATWAPALAVAGTYDVWVWWVAGTNRATAARYRVSSLDGTRDVTVNQTINGGRWIKLGSFSFGSGSAGKVDLLAASSSGGSVVSGDAARFVYKSPLDIVVDNTDAGFRASTNWTTTTATAGYLGSNYRTRITASASDSAVWAAAIPSTASYKVYARWTSGTNRAPSAPYQVIHSGGTATVNVDQRANGGTWVLLGTYTFAAGSADRVRLSCWTTAGNYVVADAIKLERQ